MPDTKKKEGEIPLVILGCAINVFKWNSLLSPRAPWMDLYQNQHKGKMFHPPHHFQSDPYVPAVVLSSTDGL